jgi:hypothetical protein
MLLYMYTGSLDFLSIKLSDKFEKVSYQKHIATAHSLCENECAPFYEFVKEAL